MIDIDETLKLTWGQGHGVKSQGQIYSYVKKSFSHVTWTEGWIMMKITCMADINEKIILIHGQGH